MSLPVSYRVDSMELYTIAGSSNGPEEHKYIIRIKGLRELEIEFPDGTVQKPHANNLLLAHLTSNGEAVVMDMIHEWESKQ